MSKKHERALKTLLDPFAGIVITGGSSGIGASFITRFFEINPGLEICNLSRGKPEVSNPELRLTHIPCDLGRAEAREKAFSLVTMWTQGLRNGRILLINNSGFGAYGRFPEPDPAVHTDMIAVNVAAPVHLTAHLLPELRKRGGAIMNVASTSAFQPTPFLGTYGATKAFLLHWSLALNEDLRGMGVDVLAVCPGPTETAFFKRAGFSQPVVSKNLGHTSEEVVETALSALNRNRAVVVSGCLNRLTAFVASKLPKVFVTRIAAKVLLRFRLEKHG